MIEALILFGVLCLACAAVCTLDDTEPLDPWGDDDA